MKKTTLSLAAALLLVGAGVSYAQPSATPPGDHRGHGAPGAQGGQMGMRHMGMRHMGMRQMDPAQMQAHRAQMEQRRADHLRTVLQLTPAQEPALKAFLAGSAPPADMMQRHMRGGAGRDARPLTTPERIDRERARMAERQQQFERRAEATKRFYAALTPTQQKAFDAIGPMGGHRGGRGGHGGHGGPGGPGMPR